jgi:hypothetical protein
LPIPVGGRHAGQQPDYDELPVNVHPVTLRS